MKLFQIIPDIVTHSMNHPAKKQPERKQLPKQSVLSRACESPNPQSAYLSVLLLLVALVFLVVRP